MDKHDVLTDIKDRAQKLTAALYKVTDLLSDKDSVKWLLRNKAIVVYDGIITLISGSLKNKNEILNETFYNVSQIIALLELTSIGGFIFNVNFEIMKKEYGKLKIIIEGKKDDLIGQGLKLLPEFSNGHSIGHSNGHHNGHSEKSNKIFEVLKNGPKNTVEITSFFKNTSEKSIQRELLKLVNIGKLKTEGEKRWRKYSLTDLTDKSI